MKIFLIYDKYGKAHRAFLRGVDELCANLAAEPPEEITLHSITSEPERNQFINETDSYDLVITEPQPANSRYSFSGYRQGELIVSKMMASQLPILFVFDDKAIVLEIAGRLRANRSNVLCYFRNLSSPEICRGLLKLINAHREKQSPSNQKTDVPITAEVVKLAPSPPKPRLRIVGDEPPTSMNPPIL